jgi:predicted nucleotidyltransferase component of viral defense system
VARFRDSNEFGPTLDAAAERLGISPTAIEKDYWVSEVLRALAHRFEGDFIFKGGTSLSKGYASWSGSRRTSMSSCFPATAASGLAGSLRAVS